MLKRALAMLLAMVMVLGMLPAGALAADTSAVSDSTAIPGETNPVNPGDEGVGDWSDWVHIPNGDSATTTISGYDGEEYGYLEIPETLDGYTVTGIGSRAFVRAVIDTLVVPGTVTSIGPRAFFQGSVSYVVFDGTEAQWASLRDRTAEGNDAFLAADHYCSRKEAILLDTPFSVTLDPWGSAGYSFEAPQTGYYMITGSGTDNGNGWYYFPYVSISNHSDSVDGNWLGFFYAEAGEVADVNVNNYNGVELSTRITFSKVSSLTVGEAVTVEMGKRGRQYYEVVLPEAGNYALEASHDEIAPDDGGSYAYFSHISAAKGSMEHMQQITADRSSYAGYRVEEDTVALCAVNNEYWDALTVKAAVLSVPETRSVEFRERQIEGYLGNSEYIYVDVDPVYGWEEMTYTSGDESILRVTGMYTGGCDVEYVGGGETTLTVTAPNGVSDTVTVFVDAPTELAPGVPSEEITLPSGVAEQYVFTVPEDGVYYFRFPMTDIEDYGWTYPDFSHSVREQDNAELLRDLWAYEEGARYCFYRLEEGMVLDLWLNNYYGWTELQASLTVDKAAAPERITASADRIVGRAEDESWIDISYGPNTAYASMQWSIGDESIAEINAGESGLGIRLLKAGETAITVTYGNVSLEIPVICWEPQNMEVGVTYEKTLAQNEYFYYTFTPAESGMYCFAIPYEEEGDDRYYINLELKDKYWLFNGSMDINGRNVHYYELTAGEQYTFITTNYYDRPLSASATIFPEPELESVSFNYESVYGKIGQQVYIEITDWSPKEARLPDLMFEIADSSVAQLLSSTSRDASIWLLDGGETVLIVSCDEFTAMLPIEVEALPAITAGETVSATLQPWQKATWQFVPEVSGFYTVTLPRINIGDSGYDMDMEVACAEGDKLYCVTENWGDVRRKICWIEAGAKVRLSLENNYGVELTPSLTLTETPEAEQVHAGELVLMLGTSTHYTPGVSPENTWSKMTFSVDNESIVKITGSDPGGVSMEAVGVGVATVTVTLENGYSTTLEVKVSQPTKLELNETAQVALEADTSGYFTFTAPEEGVYTFKTPIVDGDCAAMGFQTYDNGELMVYSGYRSSQYSYCHYWMTEGTAITMRLENPYGEEMDTSITVQKGVEATGIAFTAGTYEGKKDSMLEVYLQCLPEGAYCNGYPGFSLGQDAHAYISWADGFRAQVYLTGECVTTVSASAGNFAATATLVVTGNSKLQLGVPYHANLLPGEGVELDFTAPEDGIYMFYTPRYFVEGFGECMADMTYQNGHPDLQFLGIKELSAGRYRYYSMKAGVNVTIRFYNPNSVPMNPSLTVSKATAPSMLYFEQEHNAGAEGQMLYFSVGYAPAEAYCQLEFTVSDGTKAQITESGNNWCYVRLLSAGKVTLTASCGDISVSREIDVSAPTYVTEEKPAELSLESQQVGNVYFRFPESAVYLLQITGSHGDFYADSYGLMEGGNYQYHNGSWPEYNRQTILISADAGSVLELRVRAYMAGTFTVTAAKAPAPTEIYFAQPGLSGTVGYSSMVSVNFAPEGAWGDVSWSVADETVARIIQSGSNYAELMFLKEGKTTLIARCGSYTAAIEVTGSKPIDLTLDVTAEVPVSPRGQAYVFFEAPETGEYAFHSNRVTINDAYRPYLELYIEGGNGPWTQTGERYTNEGKVVFAHIEKGVQIRIRLESYVEMAFAGSVTATKVSTPEKLELDTTELRGIPDSYDSVSVNLLPVTAKGEVTYRIADETIARIEGAGPENCSVYLMALGKTTLTVTCGELSATLDIIVEEPTKLELNEKLDISDLERREFFCFTAPETGIYGFETPQFFYEEDGGMYSNYCRVEFNSLPSDNAYLNSYYTENSRITYAYLEAGQTVEFALNNYSGYATDTSIEAIEATTPTDIFFDVEDTITMEVGGDWCIRLLMDPGNGYAPIEHSVEGAGMLECWRNGNEFDLYAVETGTWTLTVTCGGMTRTITVNVVEKGMDIPDYGDPEEEGFAEVVGSGWEDAFDTLAEAIAGAKGGYVRLNGEIHEDITITEDTWLDLNGGVLYGNVTIEEGATLYAFDSATADYDAEDMGAIMGQITGNLARSLNTPKDLYGHNYKYMAVEWMPGAWTFHRYYLTVKSVILAPCVEEGDDIATEVRYRTVFKTNADVLDYITAHGAKFEGEETIYANYFTGGIELVGGGQQNSHVVGLGGTMKTSNTDSQNLKNALAAPKVSAYIELSDGTILESAGVEQSLQDVAAYANGLSDLRDIQKEALGKMYDVFKSVMDSWSVNIDNIKSYAAEYWGTDTSPALTITDQPKSVTVFVDQDAVFSVSAKGKGLVYQWQYLYPQDPVWRDTTMTGNKTDTLTVGGKMSRSGYKYRCVITDAKGKQVISNAATLTVKVEFAIRSQPQSATVAVGGYAYFAAVVTGEGLTYQWQYLYPQDPVWRDTTMEGNKTNTLIVGGKTSRNGYKYRCVITDAYGEQLITEAVTLTVQ